MLMNSLTIISTKTISLILSPCSHKSFPNYNCSLNNVEIQLSHTAKYLGIIVDDRLSFKTYNDFLVTKISRSVGIMIKLRSYLPTETLTTLYYALVHSHILYGLPIWAATYDTYLNKLRKLQNKAIRTVTKSNIKDRITPRYRHLGILILYDLYMYEIAKFMYQYVHNMLPSQFNNHFSFTHNIHTHETRNSTSKAMTLTRYSTNRNKNSIKYKGVKIWNSIPNHFHFKNLNMNIRNFFWTNIVNL